MLVQNSKLVKTSIMEKSLVVECVCELVRKCRFCNLSQMPHDELSTVP